MLKNYLLLAVKNFRKQKLFSIINILGLTVGITCCLMIFLFILNEFSFDRFHKHGKDIYRVMRVSHQDGTKNISYLAPIYGPTLLHDYADAIQDQVRVEPDNDLITYNNQSYNEKKVVFADSNFFSFFSFRLLKGNPATVLKDPYSLVMTETTAKKYFGNDDPIGKEVEFNKNTRFKVTGIAADAPVNSHLDFDIVVANSSRQNSPWYNQWPSNGLFVYVQMKPGADPAQLEKRFPAFMDKYLGKFYRENGFHMDLTIKPLTGIYFEGDQPWDPVKHGSKKMVYIFMSIAGLILIIACINFMNLATARATDRSKEIGLRKVMGALKKQLATQFIFESLLFAAVAASLAILLLLLVMPAYNNFLGYDLPSQWHNPWFYGFIGAIVLVVGLLAGSYPAFLMSSFSPIASLKGKLKVGTGGAFFRKALVVFQFGISVLLIVSVTIVMKQMHYVRTADLGFDKEQVMIVRLDNGVIYDHKNTFKKQLEADPSVSGVSLMSGEPGGFHDSYGFEAEAKPGDKIMLNTQFCDLQFVKTLGLKLLAGRDLSPEFPTDTMDAVLINRAAATSLGYTPQQAVGKWIKNITADSLRRTIVGVVEDYHFTSMKQVIGPLVISPRKGDRRLVLVKLRTAELQPAIARIQKVYKANAPDHPFSYEFLDERFDKLYKTEASQETLLTLFACIAIAIACLGLFGLASYTAIKRTKEIGVRKVLGSSVSNIVVLLSKDLLRPVLLGTLVAIPLGYWAMQKWLEGFAYRTDIQWWLFLLAACVAVIIALVTVSTQAIKAALANPIKSLKENE